MTLRDVVDELVGEIREGIPPVTKAPLPSPVSNDGRMVPGDKPLHELAREMERADWEQVVADDNAVTVGGLVIERLGHMPAVGEQVIVDGITLRVVETDGRTVQRVQVRLAAEPA